MATPTKKPVQAPKPGMKPAPKPEQKPGQKPMGTVKPAPAKPEPKRK